jgi:lipopolysaccharide transport system permease protein
MTSEVVSTGVGSVVANRAVLANTVFPVDLVPVKSVLLGQVTMVVGMSVILIASAVLGIISWTVVLLPIVWGLQLLSLAGVVWVLSLVNLIFRDLQNFVSVILMMLIVASPIAYTPEMVPASLKVIILLNPFAYYVIAYQQVLVMGQIPPWWDWTAILLLAVIPFYLGGLYFNRLKQAMVDYV